MAGKNLIIKPGQSLFRQGDKSNGMFLVRKGNLRIYLEKDGSQVELAQVTAGGMIGEMALFDHKPRSASVDATEPSEVTLISNQDFAKLVKQIPKWFTALMSTLSGRLRNTNERLEKLQAESSPAMQGIKSVMRILLVIDLLVHKNGEKQDKEWFLELESTLETLEFNFAENQNKITDMLAALSKVGIISMKNNSYNKRAIVLTNKGSISRFLSFLGDYLQNAHTSSLPSNALDTLKALKKFGDQQAYDTFTVSLDDLQRTDASLGELTAAANWAEDINLLAKIHADINLSIDNDQHIFKCKKKILKEITANHIALADIDHKLHGEPS